MKYEYGILHRSDTAHDPHRSGMTYEEARIWLDGWLADGGSPLAFVIIRREIGDWEVAKAPFDPSGDQERPCANPQCQHPYRRHFDWMENDEHVGCKYCPCAEFREAPID